MKIFSSVFMECGNLFLSTANTEVQPSERRKKTGNENSIWSQTFQELFLSTGEWILDGRFLRAGISVIPVLKTPDGLITILNRFDSGHPTAANKLTPPAGIWDSHEDLFHSALAELGQEIIISENEGNKIGVWKHDGQIVEQDWVCKYIDENNLYRSSYQIDVSTMPAKNTIKVFLDNVFQGNAIIAAEFDTGSVEFMFPMIATVKTKPFVRDGESFGGQWLHRQCRTYTYEEIVKIPDEEKTTKVKAVEAFMSSL
mgnify:CR=1 FL=1